MKFSFDPREPSPGTRVHRFCRRFWGMELRIFKGGYNSSTSIARHIRHRPVALVSDSSHRSWGSKPGIDATKKLPGEGFERAWPPLIRMDAAVKAKVVELIRRAR